jgi:hypothetical protein
MSEISESGNDNGAWTPLVLKRISEDTPENKKEEGIDPTRKAHRNSILRNLPKEKQAEIVCKIEEGAGENYRETSDWLQAQQIFATRDVVYNFHKGYQVMSALWEDEDLALDITDLCTQKGYIKKAKQERAVAQLIFNRLVLRRQDPRLWTMVERVNLAKDKVDMEEKKLKWHSEEFQAKKAKAKKEQKARMTPEEKEAAIRKIYGMS